MDFALRANLRLFKFVPDEFVRVLACGRPPEWRLGFMLRAPSPEPRVPSPASHPMPDTLLILCTCPNADSASRIARVLVEERLAACVNRVPGLTSVYRWQGEIHEDNE